MDQSLREAATRKVLNAIKLFFTESDVWELRIPKAGKAGTVSGYFNDPEAFARAAASYSGKVPGVYFTINPVRPDLLARANNRVIERASHTTSDANILCRRWFPIDIDPVRPAGISSSDAEHELVLERARAIREQLRQRGWSAPILASSGNGAHLLYRIDMPNDHRCQELVRKVLEALDSHFSDDRASIDKSVYNAARIWKTYGTMSCKGENLPERPHRQARILGGPGYGI